LKEEMTVGDIARVLSVLTRSDDEALEYFHVRARVSDATSVETLKWWRQFFGVLVDKLAVGDVAALENYQLALEAVLAQSDPTGVEEGAPSSSESSKGVADTPLGPGPSPALAERPAPPQAGILPH
jgi:hypothetical protein